MIELTTPLRNPIHNENLRGIQQWRHKWGQTSLYTDNNTIQIFPVPNNVPTVKSTYNYNLKAVRKNNDPEKKHGLADWALKFGLVDEAEQMMNELVAQGPGKSTNPKVAASIEAYKKIKPLIAKPIDVQTSAEYWSGKLAFRAAYSPHYALLYTSQYANPPEADRRLKQLEHHFKAYYLWFAVNGHALPMPDEKLVAILVDNPTEFKKQRDALIEGSTVDDGFHLRRENLAIFSTQRLDEGFNAFVQQTQALWKEGWDRDEMLKGKDRPKNAPKSTSINEKYKTDIPRVQTLALLETALIEEAEVAAVSHEGTRQLVIASGLLGKTTVAPEWLIFGIASFFETPKGPFHGMTGTAKSAWWHGYGGVSWAYHRHFRDWEASKDPLKKLDEPAEALRNTLADSYFRNVRSIPEVAPEIDAKLPKHVREQKEREYARQKEELTRARTYAWALTYYLARHRTDGFIKFCREMAAQPRDLEMDEGTILACFGRAFDVANATNDGVDKSKFADLASRWYQQMRTENPPGAVYDRNRQQNDPNNPGGGLGPGGPGGFGPGGPGGFGPGGPGGFGPGGPGGFGPGGPGGPGGLGGRPGGS